MFDNGDADMGIRKWSRDAGQRWVRGKDEATAIDKEDGAVRLYSLCRLTQIF